MNRNRFALFSAAAASLIGLTTVTGAADAAPSDVSLTHSINCNNLTLTATATNVGPVTEEIEFVLGLSTGPSTTPVVEVLANNSASHTFNLAAGDIVESVQIRDAVTSDLIDSDSLNLIFSSEDDCYRPTTHGVKLHDAQIKCIDGWLHFTARIENIGDFDADIALWANGGWADEETYAAASDAGWNHYEEFVIAPRGFHDVAATFKANDSLQIIGRNWSADKVFYQDGVRALQGSEELCGGNVPEVAGSGEETPTDSTLPTDTTPPSDTVPADSGSGSGSGSDTGSKPVPTTVVSESAAAGGSLPTTGTSSWVIVFAALVLSSLGGLLVRSTRRAA